MRRTHRRIANIFVQLDWRGPEIDRYGLGARRDQRLSIPSSQFESAAHRKQTSSLRLSCLGLTETKVKYGDHRD